MWNSYDLSMVDDLFLKDSKLTYFSSEKEGIIKGPEAIRKHHEGFSFIKGSKVQPNRLWLEDMQTEVFGPTAIVKATWFFQKRGVGKIQRGPATLVCAIRERVSHCSRSLLQLLTALGNNIGGSL